MPVPNDLAPVARAKVYEQTGPTLMARLVGNDASNVTQAKLSSGTYVVVDADGTTVSSGSLTIASVIFDTLQTDARWDYDDTGYNFRYAMTKTQLPAAGVYEVRFTFVPAGGYGEQFHVVFELDAQDAYI